MVVPDGQRLPFSKSLIDFLLTQEKGDRPFSTGEWLGTLSLAQLFKFITAGRHALNMWDSAEGADFLTVLVNAAGAEKRVKDSPYPVVELKGLSGRLHNLAYSEMNRRIGSAVCPKTQRLYPELSEPADNNK